LRLKIQQRIIIIKTKILKTMKTKQLLLVISFLLLQAALFAQKSPAFINDSLDVYIKRSLEAWNIPGVAVCVVKDGKVVVSKGFGVKELGGKDKIDEHTLFMIASNTKAMTGTVMAMLELEKKCSMEDAVSKWYPFFKMKDPTLVHKVNLTDIVTHRLGMETFQGDFMYIDSDFTTQQVIEKMGQLKPVYDFRTKWGYCNSGYALAGECIKNISGKSWEDNMRDRLFKPLGMDRTLVFASELKSATNKASAHTNENGILRKIPYGEMDAMAPAGSVCSSVHDLSRYMIALLDSGRIDGKEVIPFKAIERTRQPFSIVGKGRHPFNTSNYRLYGLGWALQDYMGKEIVSHTGGIHGFVTSVTLLPQENLGIVVLTNTDQNAFYEALKWEIIDAYLELPYRDYSGFYLKRNELSKASAKAELTAVKDSTKMKFANMPDLSMFEGAYNHAVYGNINIEKGQKGSLKMSFEHHPSLSAKLEYIGNNRFLSSYNNPVYEPKVIPFEIANNKVRKMIFSVSDFIEFTTYDFIKTIPANNLVPVKMNNTENQ
jgi:CubicO group peptidase (beta-lactamase class C family)